MSLLKKRKINDHLLENKTDQKIFNILKKYLPHDWLEIVFFAGYYSNDSGYFKYWIKTDDENYLDCFSLVPEPKYGGKDVLQEQLMELHKELKRIREKLTEKQKWVILTMTINNKGEFFKEYNYADGVTKDKYMQYIEEYKNQLNAKYS